MKTLGALAVALAAAVVAVPANNHTTASALVADTGSVDAIRVVSRSGARKAAGYSYSTFTTGEARVKVIVHSTPTLRPSSSLEAIDAVMRDVAAMYASWSGGKMTMTHVISETVVPEFTCSGSAASLTMTDKNFDHIIEYGPAKDCTFSGLGTLGGSWVRVVDSGFTTRVVAHELGHNLGLSHANNVQCASPDQPWSACTTKEYGDWFDLMGGGMSFGVLQKSILDWHDPTAISVNTTGEFDLAEAPAALVVADPIDEAEYWFEYERQVKRPELPSDRLLVRRTPVDGARSSSSLLVVKSQDRTYDFTRRVWITDVGLSAGETFVDPSGRIRVDVLTTGEKARLRVTAPPRPTLAAWPATYGLQSKTTGQISVERPTGAFTAQSLVSTVWYSDGTTTTQRLKPTWQTIDVRNAKYAVALRVSAHDLDGAAATSTIVLKKNPWVASAATAKAVADGVRITIADPGRYSRLAVTCGQMSEVSRVFDNPGTTVVVTGTGSRSDCQGRLLTTVDGVVTAEESFMLPKAKAPSTSIDVMNSATRIRGKTRSTTLVTVERTCRTCPSVSIRIDRWNGSKWVRGRSKSTRLRTFSATVNARAEKWRITVGKKTFTPINVTQDTSD